VLIIYTSGTTGFPKGAMHSQRNFVMAGESNISRLWLQPEDRLMVVLPMFHVNALFYSTAGALAAGCSMVLLPRFSASEFWNAAVEYGATQVNIIEAIGRILARRPRSEFRPEHRISKVYGMRADIGAVPGRVPHPASARRLRHDRDSRRLLRSVRGSEQAGHHGTGRAPS